jgi:hypothetical protein
MHLLLFALSGPAEKLAMFESMLHINLLFADVELQKRGSFF